MSPEEKRAGLGLWAGAAIVWLAICGGAVCVAVFGVLSTRGWRSPVEIEGSYVALVIGQAFFLIFIWPLFERRSSGDFAGSCIRLVSLFILSVPLILLTLRTRETGVTTLVWSQGLVLIIGVTAGAAVRLRDAVSWYYPAAFLLSAVVPLAAYLLREEGGVPTAWAGVVSPFWAAGVVASGARGLAPLIVFACLGAGALLALLFSRGPATEQA